MSDKTVMEFDVTKEELGKLLISAVSIYPVFMKMENIVKYVREDTGDFNYFITNMNQAPGVVADYLIFPDMESMKKLVNDFEKYEENSESGIDPSKENVLFFTVHQDGVEFTAESVFSGELNDLSVKEKNDMITEFLKASDRIVKRLDKELGI